MKNIGLDVYDTLEEIYFNLAYYFQVKIVQIQRTSLLKLARSFFMSLKSTEFF